LGLKRAKQETKMKQAANKALPGLFFSFGDEHNTFIRNVGWLSTDYVVLYTRRNNSLEISYIDSHQGVGKTHWWVCLNTVNNIGLWFLFSFLLSSSSSISPLLSECQWLCRNI
jgi:hypothetical protein